MSPVTRRSFLEHTLAVAAAGLAAAENARVATGAEPASQPARASSVNDRVGVAIIGLHGRGKDHLDSYTFDDRVQIVALCDIDQSTFGSAQRVLQSRGRPPAKQYTDLRRMLEDKAVDAVSIAMPNHWHTLAAIWAMQAGKDVYVEKPVSHELTEGRRLEQARLKFNRICQAGTQSRSNPAHIEGIRYIHNGGIGKVRLARGLCYKPRNSIGHFPDSEVPSGIDYDLWLGPAQVRPFNKNRFHYNWHWNWDYGNGDIGNQGIHQMDIARWALNQSLPESVISLGGRFGYEDDGQTPNTQLAFFEYPDAHLLFEVRGLKTPPVTGLLVGNIIYGSEGFVAFSNEDSRSVVAFDANGKQVKAFRGGGNHFSNFIDSVRSRTQSDLNCPVLQGHLSSRDVPHGNISYRTGDPHRSPRLMPMLGTSIDFAEAFGRFEQHLADNALDLKEMAYQSGPQRPRRRPIGNLRFPQKANAPHPGVPAAFRRPRNALIFKTRSFHAITLRPNNSSLVASNMSCWRRRRTSRWYHRCLESGERGAPNNAIARSHLSQRPVALAAGRQDSRHRTHKRLGLHQSARPMARFARRLYVGQFPDLLSRPRLAEIRSRQGGCELVSAASSRFRATGPTSASHYP